MPEPTRRNFGIRLPVELITAIEARAKATGQTKTETVEAILREALGMEVGNDAPDVGQRLTDVEQRLTIVERRLASSAQQRNTPPPPSPAVATEGTATGQGSTEGIDHSFPSRPGVGQAASPGESYSTAEALIASGAPITESQARGTNANAAMRRKAGLDVAEWLGVRGWVRDGKRWQRVGSDTTAASYRKVR